MSEYLKREDVRRIVLHNDRDAALAAIDALQPVEVAHCGECERGTPDEDPQNDGKKYVWCKHWHAWKPEDGFCDLNERKEKADDD